MEVRTAIRRIASMAFIGLGALCLWLWLFVVIGEMGYKSADPWLLFGLPICVIGTLLSFACAWRLRTAPRHWFRFSLRTLLAVVTVCACWLGYQLNWIKERRDALALRGVMPLIINDGKPHAQALFPLDLFGERGYDAINFRHNARFDSVRLERLFPEAKWVGNLRGVGLRFKGQAMQMSEDLERMRGRGLFTDAELDAWKAELSGP